jgi:hypothetical protein
VEADVAASPVHGPALGGEAVVADPQGLARTLLEILRGFGHDCMVQTGAPSPTVNAWPVRARSLIDEGDHQGDLHRIDRR